jgi:hypothetical protein
MGAAEAKGAILDALKDLRRVADDQPAETEIEFAGLNVITIKTVDLCGGLWERVVTT